MVLVSMYLRVMERKEGMERKMRESSSHNQYAVVVINLICIAKLRTIECSCKLTLARFRS